MIYDISSYVNFFSIVEVWYDVFEAMTSLYQIITKLTK